MRERGVIPFFAGYAVLIWFPAAYWRRQWRGFGVVLLGTAILVGLAFAHAEWARMQSGRVFAPVFQSLLFPFIALVGGGGGFLASMPRRHPDGNCGSCGYDLSWITENDRRCPECGGSIPLVTTRGCCRACKRDLSQVFEPEGVCPDCRTPFVRLRTDAIRREQERKWAKPIEDREPAVSPAPPAR